MMQIFMMKDVPEYGLKFSEVVDVPSWRAAELIERKAAVEYRGTIRVTENKLAQAPDTKGSDDDDQHEG